MQNTTSAETGTAQASRLTDKTYFYVRLYRGENKNWIICKEFNTLPEAEEYLRDCIRGNGLMILEEPVRAKYQIVKAVATREIMKTWEGDVR